MKTYQGLSHKD